MTDTIPVPAPTSFARWLYSGRSAIERANAGALGATPLLPGRDAVVDARRTAPPLPAR
ncbi:hypothetical protein [Haloarcula salina]|uniref:Uncharacterized protein n=1 Tax=Haloarcula salina TaxID=1429914 RepID=A0AA41KDD2_9EURY|nr:hypothetical protein [Haloarcula salina]MBV0903400.1 hypothetical protein [Haloarcula salina]